MNNALQRIRVAFLFASFFLSPISVTGCNQGLRPSGVEKVPPALQVAFTNWKSAGDAIPDEKSRWYMKDREVFASVQSIASHNEFKVVIDFLTWQLDENDGADRELVAFQGSIHRNAVLYAISQQDAVLVLRLLEVGCPEEYGIQLIEWELADGFGKDGSVTGIEVLFDAIRQAKDKSSSECLMRAAHRALAGMIGNDVDLRKMEQWFVEHRDRLQLNRNYPLDPDPGADRLYGLPVAIVKERVR